MEERKDKIEIIIDKIKVCFWEHEDFDDIKVREILEQELDRARGGGRKELIKEIRESIKENIKIDDTEYKHIKIDTDIVKILDDKEITKMFLDGEEGEDIDRDCSWGWYS